MKVVQFLVFGIMGALIVACGAWAVVWFSGLPISRSSILTQSDYKPIHESPQSNKTIVAHEKDKPLETAPTRVLSGTNNAEDRRRRDSDTELNKKINSICRGC